MKLEHVKIENYMQHRDLSVDFDGSLIAVLGRNGSGKSNFLGALQFALTGEQPGKNKEDLVSWGEEDGFVQLDFSHAGHGCSIRRGIATPSCSITIDGEKTNGAKAVGAILSEQFGVDKDLFRQVVFVRQAEVDSILFDEPRKRELAFQRLAGLGDTEKMYNVLGGVISKYDGQDNYDTYLDDAERSLADTKRRSEEMAEKVESLEKELAGLPPKEAMLNLLSQIQSAIGTEKQRIEMEAQLARDTQALDAASRKVSEIASMPHDTRTVSEMTEAKTALEKTLEKLDAAARAAEKADLARTTLESAMAVVAPSLADVESAEKENDIDKSAAAALSNRISTLKEYLHVVQGSGNCPVCGSALAFDLKKKLEDELRSATLEHEKIKSRIGMARHVQMRKAYSDKLVAVERAKSMLDAANADLEVANSAVPVDEAASDRSVLRETVSALSMAISTRLAWEKAMGDAEMMANACRIAVERVKASVSKDEGREDIQKLSKDAAAVSDGIHKHDETSTLLATMRGTVKALLEQVTASEKYIDDLKAKKKVADETRRRVGVLSTVRRALHYTAIPRTLSQKIVSRLTDGVNNYLDLFSAPFTVVPADEGVGFDCRFTDGRTMPSELPDATVLSGGQKVQLAVAFRFATYELFAPKLGLLVMDEPTAYLDDSAIGRFGDVLKKIMETAKAMNVQILCATHHQQVSAQADKTIEF